MEGPQADSRVFLPKPKSVDLIRSTVRLCRNVSATIDSRDARVAAAWRRLASELPVSGDGTSILRLIVHEDPARTGNCDGYRISIRDNLVEITGGSPAGCFYGLKTLGQLIDPGTGQLPCGEIVDEPDYRTRGLLHDVTRGKCPKIETLKLLADRLADLKVNQLQLYIEHAFVFSFDPDICGPGEGLTPDEIGELDRYCRDRFIDLVPAVATLGHMGRILSMPRYRHLAEIEATKAWEQMSWLERMRGFTLDVLNPASRDVVERIWSDVLDAFSSPIVNICGDEPWDLGRGKNADRLDAETRGEAYVDYIAWTHGLCAKRGRRTQLWGDVVRNYPNLLHRLPKDLTVLHWGYDDRADYEDTHVFTEAGLDTCVCPGASGWKRIINAMDLAERNIAAFAKAGKRHGASGLINTDWGDFGHFNQLACSWHGIALGAAYAWNVAEPGGSDFDECFAATFLDAPGELVDHLRAASAIATSCDTWRLLAASDEELAREKKLPRPADAEKAAEAAGRARQILESKRPPDHVPAQDDRELALACRFTELFAQRVAGRHDRNWKDALREAARCYSECWGARNKPLRLADVTAKLGRLAE